MMAREPGTVLLSLSVYTQTILSISLFEPLLLSSFTWFVLTVFFCVPVTYGQLELFF